MTRKTSLSGFPDKAECTVRENEYGKLNILSQKERERSRCMKRLALSSFLILTLIAIVRTLFFGRTSESSKPIESPLQNERRTTKSSKPPPTKSPAQKPSQSPSEHPTLFPSSVPSDLPSLQPSHVISSLPSIEPSTFSSEFPSDEPSITPTMLPTSLNAIFYVIGDIPYTTSEKESLIQHVDTLPGDAEFLVHVGDIRTAHGTDCTFAEFDVVANILKASPVPVFIVPGDNEYNDCPNLAESWDDWKAVFGEFENNWNTSLNVSHDNDRTENFYFVHKRVLYIGLNIVGGKDTDKEEWQTRLDHEWNWTQHLVETYVLPQSSVASAVVIFGHADPNHAHATFFDPLRKFIKVELKNRIPFLYVNGDRHYFQFDSDFYGQSNFHRIMVEGGSTEPPLQLSVSGSQINETS
eukprot:scaffold3791_cov137-Cylindrotheca_fusiformis.AAC.20